MISSVIASLFIFTDMGQDNNHSELILHLGKRDVQSFVLEQY